MVQQQQHGVMHPGGSQVQQVQQSQPVMVYNPTGSAGQMPTNRMQGVQGMVSGGGNPGANPSMQIPVRIAIACCMHAVFPSPVAFVLYYTTN